MAIRDSEPQSDPGPALDTKLDILGPELKLAPGSLGPRGARQGSVQSGWCCPNRRHAPARSRRPTAAKAEVEYRASLVAASPSGSLWDKLSYIATVLFGAGGAAFFFFAANLASNPEWYVPAVVLWVAASALMISSLVGIGRADRKRFNFFSYQFEIPEKFKP